MDHCLCQLIPETGCLVMRVGWVKGHVTFTGYFMEVTLRHISLCSPILYYTSYLGIQFPASNSLDSVITLTRYFLETSFTLRSFRPKALFGQTQSRHRHGVH